MVYKVQDAIILVQTLVIYAVSFLHQLGLHGTISRFCRFGIKKKCDMRRVTLVSCFSWCHHSPSYIPFFLFISGLLPYLYFSQAIMACFICMDGELSLSAHARAHAFCVTLHFLDFHPNKMEDLSFIYLQK